jgi:bifunctional UDP-N-acetylglucosamine pyrophosphorylase/glucosamine-1-phosphate N-acetyltransferase
VKRPLWIVVLAAGLGTRMRSEIPKVLHKLNGRPMLQWVLDTAEKLKPGKTIVVCNRSNVKPVRNDISHNTVEFVIQSKPLGTAHALLSVKKLIEEFSGDILVLNGDTPMISPDTLKRFLQRHRRSKNSLSIISFEIDNPSGYGRIIRDSYGSPIMIKEETDLTKEEAQIKEVNSGVYLMDYSAFQLLRRIKKNSRKGEYYLTDILALATNRGLRCGVYKMGDEVEFMGINTKEELQKAQRLMRQKVVKTWLQNDVGMMDEDRVYIGPDVAIGEGTYIYPDVYIEGETSIGKNCIIYPNVRIVDCKISDNVVIREYSSLEKSVVESGATVGPFARLRPGTLLKEGAKIGNFVEVKNSLVGEGTKALHLSYIGDAEIGKGVNIGAGTITCNYDGKKKYKTIIEDNVFIGSDTQLVAPVRVKKGAYVGAGSTITKEVPEGALALSRTEQRNINGWVKKRFKKRGKR